MGGKASRAWRAAMRRAERDAWWAEASIVFLLVTVVEAVQQPETTMNKQVPQPQTAPLTVQVFNPGEDAVSDFAVSSVLVEGKREALLIDAQFLTVRAGKLVEQIRASGNHLSTIYISHGDPIPDSAARAHWN
jgi:hypothetical protein